MQTPNELFGLPSDADEAQIRNRYLELVREFPPDRAPERFAEIREAYDALRDPLPRAERRLFHFSSHDSMKQLQTDIRKHLAAAPLTMDVLLSLAEPS
jgi:DnaJ-class molecular chaperone